jgi:hypothetical protein
MKLFKVIFGTGFYFYATTILTQYSYNSYFGIPTSYIEFSIKDVVIFFFDLLNIAKTVIVNVAGNLSFWALAGLIIVSIFIGFLLIFDLIPKSVNPIFIIIFTAVSFFGFYNFGNNIAKLTTEFRVIPAECISSEKNITYIIPSFTGTTAIITPIYTDSKKLTGSFLTKESSSLNCEITKETVGQIQKQ